MSLEEFHRVDDSMKQNCTSPTWPVVFARELEKHVDIPEVMVRAVLDVPPEFASALAYEDHARITLGPSPDCSVRGIENQRLLVFTGRVELARWLMRELAKEADRAPQPEPMLRDSENK
jgi:hypothetical protein